MAACDVCGSPLSAGAVGEAGSWQSHVSDFNDPHRTLELVRKIIPGLSAGSAEPGSADGAKPGDLFADLASGALWACLAQQDGSLAWTKVADRSPASADLTAYATKAMLADYATVASLSGYLRPADLPGYNFVAQSDLADALLPFALKTDVTAAISAGGFLTQTVADGRYVLAGTAAEREYVTRTQLAEALAGYLSTSAASATYLTVEAADGEDGFLRKTATLPYVTPDQLSTRLEGYALMTSLSGFITQVEADGRYLMAGTETGAVVTVGDLNAALAQYLRTADAESKLNLSGYLTISAADSPQGFVRKAGFATAASAAGLVTSSALSTELATYVTQANVESVVNEKVAAVAGNFATAEDLADLASSIAIEKGNGTSLATLEPDGGKFKPAARSNNLVVLKGDMVEIPLLMPVRSQGAARDFILTVAFDRGLSMWAGTSFEIVPSTRQTEAAQNRFFSATAGVFEVDASLFDLDRQMVVFGFTEVADGRFLVSRKVVTEQGA